MKILPILLFLAVQAFSQKSSKDTLVRYFNAELEPCKKKEFVFIGLVIRDQGGWSGIIYDDSTRIIMRGRYKDDDCLVKNGWFMYYFSNGRRSLGGKFDNNIRQGNWLQWYPSGQLRDSIFFVNNLANGPSFSFYENGQPESAGIYRQGKYSHEWVFYHENGKPSTREKYVDEKLSDLECFDSSGKSMGFNCALNRAPEIKGKYGGFEKYLADSIRYPDAAKKNAIKGIVQVEFTITKEGEVKNLNILSSPDKILSDEVLRVIKSVPGWYPAISHNRLMDYTFKMNVPFLVDQQPLIDNKDFFEYRTPYYGEDF
jgi:TonB family protein